MSTPFEEQEKLAPEIAKLFGAVPNDVMVDQEDFSVLKSAIDSAVHFYYYLTERMESPLNPYGAATDRVIDDIATYTEFYWKVRTNIRILLEERTEEFQWTSVSSPEDLRTRFLASYQKLIEKKTRTVERYYHLMVLSQLQLIFLGAVFV